MTAEERRKAFTAALDRVLAAHGTSIWFHNNCAPSSPGRIQAYLEYEAERERFIAEFVEPAPVAEEKTP